MHSIFFSFILNFIKNSQLFFKDSVFNKIQDGTKTIWLKLTKNSFFATWFSTEPKIETKNSYIYSTLTTIFNFISKIFMWFSKILKKSYIISSLTDWYKNFFASSITNYSSFLLFFTLPYLVSSLFLRQTITISIASIVILISVLGIYCNKSLIQLFSNSNITKFIAKLFDFQLEEMNTFKPYSKKSIIIHSLIGIIVSITSLITKSCLIPILLIGILGLGAIFFNYKIGLYTGLILMPFLPTMGVVGIILLSFVSFLIKLLTTPNFKFKHTPLDIPIAFLGIIMFFSTITSYALGNSIKVFLVYFTFMLSYYLLTNSIKTKQELLSLISGMLFAGVIVALYGIYQYVFGFSEGTIWTDNEMFDIKTRVVSTFSNPNVLGEYLLLLIPISTGYIFSKKDLIQKTSNTAITILLGLCMIFTYSRGNWLGLLIAMTLFFMFYDGKFVWWAMLGMLFVPIFLPDTIMDRFMSIGNTADSSTSYRVNIWYGTCRMLKDYWLTGVGLGSQAFSSIYQHYSYSGIITQHSHNLYLQLISENGILGLTTFVAIILIYYKTCISSIIKTEDKVLKSTITGLSAGMFGYLVQGMFDNVWYNYRIVFMFFIILALTNTAINIIKNNGGKNI